MNWQYQMFLAWTSSARNGWAKHVQSNIFFIQIDDHSWAPTFGSFISALGEASLDGGSEVRHGPRSGPIVGIGVHPNERAGVTADILVSVLENKEEGLVEWVAVGQSTCRFIRGQISGLAVRRKDVSHDANSGQLSAQQAGHLAAAEH